MLTDGVITVDIPSGDMSIGTYTADQGDTSVMIPINGTWLVTISGYSIGMQFDPSIITIVNVSNVGTIAEDAFIWSWYEPSPGLLTLGAAWMMPPDFKPPGSGILAYLELDIDINATLGDTTLDLGQFGGSPPVECAYSDQNSNAVYPDTIDGTLTVEEFVPFICGDVDGQSIGGTVINVADLTYLVDYLFRSGPAPIPFVCVGNVDGQVIGGTVVNVADLTYLVDYLFRSGPPPVDTCCDL